MKLSLQFTEEDFFSLKTISVFKEFCKRLGLDNVEYANFNHYFEFEGDVPKIRIRFDFKDQETIENALKLAEDLKNEGKIVMYGWDTANPEEYVKLAHELSTKCAIAIYDTGSLVQISQKGPSEKRIILKWFFYHFFKKFGITMPFTNQQLGNLSEESDPVQKIKELSNYCFKRCKKDFKFKNPDFICKFIHLFCNCVQFGQSPRPDLDIERHFWANLCRAYSFDFSEEGKKEVCKKISFEIEKIMEE